MRRSLVAAALVLGCAPPNDVGRATELIKMGEAGAAKVVEIGEIDLDKDYVSIGTADCDSIIAVRHAGHPLDGDGNGSADAYCSRECNSLVESTCASVDPGLKLLCRPMGAGPTYGTYCAAE